jgi:hypothetical protein
VTSGKVEALRYLGVQLEKANIKIQLLNLKSLLDQIFVFKFFFSVAVHLRPSIVTDTNAIINIS